MKTYPPEPVQLNSNLVMESTRNSEKDWNMMSDIVRIEKAVKYEHRRTS